MRPLPSEFTPPEWVFVWFWLRFTREPQVMAALPQQDFYAPRPVPMTGETYELYRQEWATAGSPRTSVAEVLVAMGADRPLAKACDYVEPAF